MTRETAINLFAQFDKFDVQLIVNDNQSIKRD